VTDSRIHLSLVFFKMFLNISCLQRLYTYYTNSAIHLAALEALVVGKLGAVIANQKTFCHINMFPDFQPKPVCAWKKPMQLTGERVMRQAACFIRLNTFRFHAAIDFLRPYQKIYVITVCYL
jgi:hypothetical protein